MADKQCMIKCGHCGNRAPMAVEGRAERRLEIGPPQYGDWVCIWWKLLVCPNCHRPILTEADTEDLDDEGQPCTRTLYPLQTEPDIALPKNVREAYRMALRARHGEPNALAVLITRVLECIFEDKRIGDSDECSAHDSCSLCLKDKCLCNAKHYPGLTSKIDCLARRGEIPPILATVAHQLREVREHGAHVKDVDVLDADVPQLVELTGLLLEYVYVLPTRVQKLKEEIAERKQAAEHTVGDEEW